MNPILAIIAALASLKDDIRAKFNAALKNLGPIEQVEASQSVIGVLREVDWAADRISRVSGELDEQIKGAEQVLNDLTAKAAKDAISAGIAARELILAADHQTALTAAVENARTAAKAEAKVEFDAALAAQKTVAQRRAEFADKAGAIAAASVTDEQLLSGNYPALLAAAVKRVDVLKEANITAEARPKVFGDLMAIGYDESGEAVFTARLDVVKEAAGGALSAATPPPPTPATTAGVIPTGTAAANKPKFLV